jgi:hypothetical protein
MRTMGKIFFCECLTRDGRPHSLALAYYRAISTAVRDQKNKKFLSEGRVIESIEIYLILCFREIPTVRTPTATNQP